jgi:hypothetical protein
MWWWTSGGVPHLREWLSLTLAAAQCQQLYVPPGFAHGFAVVSNEATVLYKCTDFYHPEDEQGIIWNDPDLAIPWPAAAPVLSDKDREYPRLREKTPEQLPVYSKYVKSLLGGGLGEQWLPHPPPTVAHESWAHSKSGKIWWGGP